jgi:hypothetical protein
MTAVFADTFYYIALMHRADVAHQRAFDFTARFRGTIVTTAWVITELADALADPAHRAAFLRLHDDLRNEPRVTILPADQQLMDQGVDLYRRRADKGWSLTDCISFVVMGDQSLTEALTADHHFEQAGFTALLK